MSCIRDRGSSQNPSCPFPSPGKTVSIGLNKSAMDDEYNPHRETSGISQSVPVRISNPTAHSVEFSQLSPASQGKTSGFRLSDVELGGSTARGHQNLHTWTASLSIVSVGC